jgi:hypothetical protein
MGTLPAPISTFSAAGAAAGGGASLSLAAQSLSASATFVQISWSMTNYTDPTMRVLASLDLSTNGGTTWNTGRVGAGVVGGTSTLNCTVAIRFPAGLTNSVRASLSVISGQTQTSLSTTLSVAQYAGV